MLTELFIITCYMDGQLVWTTAGRTELQARASVPGHIMFQRGTITQWILNGNYNNGKCGWRKQGTTKWPA